MKIVFVSTLLVFLLVTTTPISKEQNNKGVDKFEKMINENEENIFKAHAVVKIADQQQKDKMNKLRETVCKLEKEKQMLKLTLELTKNQLVVMKEIHSNPTDSIGY